MSFVRTKIIPFGIFSFTLIVLLFYFRHYPLPLFWWRFYEACLLGYLSLISLCFGRAALKWFGLVPHSRLESVAFAGALGLGLLALAVFLLGIAGILTVRMAILLLTVLLLLGIKELPLLAQEWMTERLETPPFWGVVALLGLVFTALAALAPPHYYDSLVYHLALPEIYVREHKISFVPFNLYSHFPENAEMLFALALLFQDDVLANLIVWLFTALSGAGIYGAAARLAGKKTAGLALALFWTMPAVMLLGSGTYVEMVSACFVFLAVLALGYWWEEEKKPWLILSALLTGLAMGTKYTGVLTGAVLSLLVLAKSCRLSSWRQKIQPLFIFVGLASLVVSPWLIKNGVFVQNPVFPFFTNIFGSGSIPWGQETAQGYFAMLTEYHPNSHSLKDLLLLPWRAVMESTKFGGGFDVLGDTGWVIFLALLPLALLAPSPPPAVKVLAAYSALHFLLWFRTAQVLRFLTAITPLLAILAGWGAQTALETFPRATRRALYSVVGLMVINQFFLFFYVQGIFGSFRPVLGLETRHEFLSKKFSYYNAYRFLNTQDNVQKVLIVGEQRGYGCRKPYLATTAFAPNPFVTWAEAAADEQALAAKLQAEQISHILLVEREGKRLDQGYHIFAWSPPAKARWENVLKKYFKIVYDKQQTKFYERIL